MKLLLPVVVAVLAATAAPALSAPQPQRPQFGTHENLDPLLGDQQLVRAQIDCVLGVKNCNRLGSQLKVAIPEVIQNNCRSCNPGQARNANKLITFVRMNYPREYQQILARYSGRSG